MNLGDSFASAYGMVDITGTKLLPDQINFVPSNFTQMVAKEGQSCYSPSFPPGPGLYCDSNFIARRPNWQPPPSYSTYEFYNGMNWSWQTSPNQPDNQERCYCLL